MRLAISGFDRFQLLRRVLLSEHMNAMVRFSFNFSLKSVFAFEQFGIGALMDIDVRRGESFDKSASAEPL